MKRTWEVTQMVAVWVRVRVSEEDLARAAACEEDARESACDAARKKLRVLIDEMDAALSANGGGVTDRDLMPDFGPDIEVEQVAGDPLPPRHPAPPREAALEAARRWEARDPNNRRLLISEDGVTLMDRRQHWAGEDGRYLSVGYAAFDVAGTGMVPADFRTRGVMPESIDTLPEWEEVIADGRRP